LSQNSTVALTEPLPPTQPSGLRKVFIGKDGLRAGWSLLIFIALVAAIAFAVNRVSHKFFPAAANGPKPGSEIAPVFIFTAELIPFLIILLVSWIMSKIERRPNSVYGFGGTRRLANFFSGFAWGVTFLSLLVLTLWKTGLLVFDGRLLFGSSIPRYGVIWLLGFLLVGLLEEYLTRGYVQYTLTRGLTGIYQWAFKTRHSAALGFWTSAAIFSILFGLGHGKNPGDWALHRWVGRPGFLPQPVAHRIALVGHRLPCLMGLGAILSLRRRRQRHDGATSSAGHACAGQTHSERRSDRP
jgi:membrane protease YdiL (CAAX protease family)